MYTLERLNSQNETRWDKILAQCPGTSAFHSIAWRDALENAFTQLSSIYYLIKENDAFIGGFPAFVFQPIPGIKMLRSMPWNLCGGLQLIDEGSVNIDCLIQLIERDLTDVAAEQKLCDTVFTLSPWQTASHGRRFAMAGYQKHETLFTHILRTSTDYQVVWNAYNKRVRGAVRKARKYGVSVYNTNSEEDFQMFYEAYLATVTGLGGTPKPSSLLYAIYNSSIANLAIAKRDGIVIGGILYLCFNRTVTLWCEASGPQFLKYRPNNAIFPHIIEWACSEGYEWVDFGASPAHHQGLISHKEQYKAHRFDFCSYIKIHSPLRRALWEQSDPILRQIYTWIQQVRCGK